jgi:hypothetical protein
MVRIDAERSPVDTSSETEGIGQRSEVEELRLALAHMSGAERRLRGRDQSRPGELTVAQIRSLAALGREREMTAGQLARSADLNPATVTAMLDHLEAAASSRDIAAARTGGYATSRSPPRAGSCWSESSPAGSHSGKSSWSASPTATWRPRCASSSR